MKWPELDAALEEVRLALPNELEPGEVAMWKDTADYLSAAVKTLKGYVEWIGQVCYEAVPPGEVSVSEGRQFKRTGTPKRSEFDDDGLRMAVLDSRLILPGTGEIVDESPLDKILHVYPTPGRNARLMALKERGIDPDQFSRTEWSGRNVKEIGV